MKDLKALRDDLKEIIAAMTISDEKLTKEWLLLGQMERTFYSITLDDNRRVMGHEMTDEDYLKHWNEKQPLKDWIEQQRERRLHPFAPAPSGQPRSAGGDISDLDPTTITDKLTSSRKRR